ncbi:hypothetical protein QTI66_32220 [Variovorax sp. J22R133]|uniref:hypothetical protein n=1 Tax=Variovorax brevis TaxID=3053503 RepID=UPI002575E654|nr:hypothetical protein [Variovorax sp. J22R133]MDM0116803.1 hypothetical protein [Variovorax sp. J22R133]
MTITTPDVQATMRKVRHYQLSQWVGHLTPSEANSPVQAGATPGPQDRAWMEAGLQAGSDSTRWFYFSANPALRTLLRAPERRPSGSVAAIRPSTGVISFLDGTVLRTASGSLSSSASWWCQGNGASTAWTIAFIGPSLGIARM